MRKVLLLGVALLACGSWVGAQEQDTEESEAPASPRRVIKVLEDPYDLASFYRSPERPYFGYGPTEAAGNGYYSSLRARHRIASFYRQGGGGRYSRFWESGYGARPRLDGNVYGPAYRDTVGEQGDLYLLAPFLAPVGPLAGAFYR